MIKYLIIDTSSEYGSIGYFEEKKKKFGFELEINKSYSEIITPIIDIMEKVSVLNIHNLDFIGINIGPGSFTGTRIGIATAKGLALQDNIPIIPITSFQAIRKKVKDDSRTIIPFIDARKKQVFSEIKNNKEYILYPGSYFPEKVISLSPDNSFFIGTGIKYYKELLDNNGKEYYENKELFLLKEIACLSYDRFINGKALPLNKIKPVYLRRSEAEINILKKKNKKLLKKLT
jgi:tRNA threonylcarbamoyladenosine biosynthesis protein TsaB